VKVNQDQHHLPLHKDVFFRSHVVELEPKGPLVSTYSEPIWPDYALVFDTETTLDPREQSLLFGLYRVCSARGGGEYVCVEEGIFHDDNIEQKSLDVITDYARSRDSEVVSDDYDDDIHVYTRTEFVESVFFHAVITRSLIVAFNAPFDISRLSVGRPRTAKNRAWTLTLSQREFDPSKLESNWLTKKWQITKKGNLSTRAGCYTVVIKQDGTAYKANVYTHGRLCSDGKWKPTLNEAKLDGLRILSEDVEVAKQIGPVLEPNPERPCIRVTSKDSKAAFFSLTKPLRPEEWPTYQVGDKTRMVFRVLDLHTLAWALFNEQYSLKRACKELKTKKPKGRP